MEKKAYQVDLNLSVRCAILAEDEQDAKKVAEKEVGKLLSAAPVTGFNVEVTKVESRSTR